MEREKRTEERRVRGGRQGNWDEEGGMERKFIGCREN